MEYLKRTAFDGRSQYKAGIITREEAKELIMPYIKEFNKKATEIAKKYNMRAKKISFAQFVR